MTTLPFSALRTADETVAAQRASFDRFAALHDYATAVSVLLDELDDEDMEAVMEEFRDKYGRRVSLDD